MYYVSCEEWVNENFPKYNIKIAYSKDGLNWIQDGTVCISLKKNERAIARPCVIKEQGIYKMWYNCEIGVGNYRMGYAESYNGIKWVRKDNKINFPLGKKGEFDDQMTEYPFVINLNKNKFMFYNGNFYGRDGVALAINEKKD